MTQSNIMESAWGRQIAVAVREGQYVHSSQPLGLFDAFVSNEKVWRKKKILIQEVKEKLFFYNLIFAFFCEDSHNQSAVEK